MLLRSVVGRRARGLGQFAGGLQVGRCALHTVLLNYQTPHPEKATGRYINQEDKGDVVDTHEAYEVVMRDGRALETPATLESMGFCLEAQPSRCVDFRDEEAVVETYYEEMRDLVKRTSGASRVLVFDHTIRESGNTNLNAAAGGSAAPVPRVHCDYTADGAPRRLAQLGKEGLFSRLKARNLTDDEVGALSTHHFAGLCPELLAFRNNETGSPRFFGCDGGAPPTCFWPKRVFRVQ